MTNQFITAWDKIKMDFKERFLNFETAKGMYLVPAGVIVCYVSVYYQQHVITVCGLLFGWYLVSEGLRKILVNRFKQERKKEELRQQRTLMTGETDNLPGVAAAEAGITNVAENAQVIDAKKS